MLLILMYVLTWGVPEFDSSVPPPEPFCFFLASFFSFKASSNFWKWTSQKSVLVLKYEFCNKAFRKDQPLTSSTLLSKYLSSLFGGFDIAPSNRKSMKLLIILFSPASWTDFYQFLHDVIIKLFCRLKQNNFMITSCKTW